jgi:hypothetical protein
MAMRTPPKRLSWVLPTFVQQEVFECNGNIPTNLTEMKKLAKISLARVPVLLTVETR